MTIDSVKYNGLCSCGRAHTMQTLFSVVKKDALFEMDALLAKYGLSGYTVAVYDENTYRATADRHPKADLEVILDPTNLHANEHGVALLMEKLPKEAEILIAVGAGTIHDITRYCAYTEGARFISCPTAASVDGFCSSVAAMTWHGCKKTLTAVAPILVVADTAVIMQAPARLTRSGFGDMIGKYIALADWKIASILTGEFYCERIAALMQDATSAVLDAVVGIKEGKSDAYEKLMSGLLLSGLAMQMMGNSRPASGAEHHISHFIEMAPPPFALRSDALHGEKVGVGTLLAIREYKRLTRITPTFADYTPATPEKIKALFGEDMAKEILVENERDAALGITAARLEACWDAVRAVLEALPDPDALDATYASFGAKRTLPDIDVDEAAAPALLSYSYLVRNRVTLARLRRALGEE